jgi:hypothetical protein
MTQQILTFADRQSPSCTFVQPQCRLDAGGPVLKRRDDCLEDWHNQFSREPPHRHQHTHYRPGFRGGPGALARVLERFQNLNVLPRRVIAELATTGVFHIEVDGEGAPTGSRPASAPSATSKTPKLKGT